MKKFSHIDKNGKAKMVDVSKKDDSLREATVVCMVQLNQNTFDLVKSNQINKGDVFTVANIAGIQAAKKTSELIPLCHPIAIDHVDITFELSESEHKINITSIVKTTSTTGVEMEAFCACSVAAVTIYDMIKSVQKDVIISDLKLLNKKGGKSGEFNRTNI